jgi:hypothetical protein
MGDDIMAFDPSTAQLVSSGFDPSTAQLVGSSAPQQNEMTQSSAPAPEATPYLDKAAAATGAISTTAGNVIQGVNDTLPWLLKHLEVISPETANKWYKENEKATDIFRVNPEGDQSDVFNKKASENPYTYYGTKLATDAYALTRGMKGSNLLGEGAKALIPSFGRSAGVLGRMAGSGLVTQATVNPEDKDLAFATGAALSPAADALGYVAGGAKAAKIDQLNTIRQTASKSKVNAAYNIVKNMAYTADDVAASTQLVTQIKDIITSNAASLSKPQTRRLNNLVNQLTNAKSHSDILKVLQNTGAGTRFFKGIEATDEVYQMYSGLKGKLENIINQAAIRNSVPNALQDASQLAKQGRITKKIFKELNANPDGFSFKTAAKNLLLEIEDLDDTPALNQTKQVLMGLHKVTRELANSYKIPKSALMLGSATLAGSYGYATGGGVGGAIGTVAGGVLGPVIFSKLNALAASPDGQAFLKSLASPAINQKDIRSIIKSLVSSDEEPTPDQANAR